MSNIYQITSQCGLNASNGLCGEVMAICEPLGNLGISLMEHSGKVFLGESLSFRISLSRSAMPNDKSNSAFCSAGIAARQSRNNLFCIITLKFQRLHFLCL